MRRRTTEVPEPPSGVHDSFTARPDHGRWKEGPVVEKEDEMRRSIWIVVLLLMILGGVAIGVGAYNAGVNHGLAETGHAVQVIRYAGPGWGFVPFGFLLFPLFVFLLFAVLRGVFWGRRWGGSGGSHGPGGWSKGGPPAFEDWHRRQHEQRSGEQPGAGEEPARA
jgi:hypothetical protein